MIALEQVAKLETLLARIRSRASARPSVDASLDLAAAPPEPPRRTPSVMPEPPPRVASVPPEALHAAQLETTPPPSMGAPATVASSPPSGQYWSEPPATEAETDEMNLDGEMDVEVSSEIVEVDIDDDDPSLVEAGFPRESGALLIAPPRARTEELGEEIPDDLVESIPPAEPPANEVVEPAPSSSPRAIESYEPTPRHTPPPESGKQVAVASVKPEARLSSAPPPPSDGHTLMGGWREPGMPLPRGEGRPGVRVPPPPPPPPAELLSAAPPPPPPLTAATPSMTAKPLTAVTTAPSFPSFAEVGVLSSPASAFAPASFGDLLDATLSL